MKPVKLESCPHLGILTDAGTHMAYSSPYNHCHGSASAPAPVKISHQHAFCLCEGYKSCPVYLGSGKKPFPSNLRERSLEEISPGKTKGTWFLLVLLLMAGLGVFIFLRAPSAVTQPSPSASLALETMGSLEPVTTSSPLALVFDYKETTVTPVFTQDPLIFPTLTPSSFPTLPPPATHTPLAVFPTPEPGSSRTLGAIIGNEKKFIIHRVIKGDNLLLLSQLYGTSVEAISHCTYNLFIPIKVDALLVVPVGNPDSLGLPAFEPMLVTADTTVEAFAVSVQGDQKLIKYYNNLADGETLQTGDWVLVPR